MTTFAIIGAGPGLGMASAKKFGHEGFSVALIARNEEKLQRLVSQLREEGITADAFTADIRDRDSLKSALDTAAAQLGTIEVVQYSPVPAREFMKPVLETQPEDLNGPLELSVLGPVTVVQQVLGGMRELGRGTFLFPNGGSAVKPRNEVTGTSVAFAGESAYAQPAPTDVHLGTFSVYDSLRCFSR